ncbi:MAG: DUF2190 family protein [Myxococcales bacterium]|uniref:DUF2190 family protein n=1 Tax=Sediminibacterium sp. TaxID=1917865 RepID=UPI001DA52775|nr:DUF2190 family protein [Sediminibacterium sp.]MBT9485832.1 DUF2190 family protein [Sediminibacterium sp.]MBT9556858.1 DUF2190 family protein [Myxococcales bacterium]
MKTHLAAQLISLVATGVIRKWRGVTFAGAEITVPGTFARGIAMDAAAASGDQIAVATLGEVPVESGGSFDAGAIVAFDDEGRVVESNGGGPCGLAVEASTGAGQFPLIRLSLVPSVNQIIETATAAADIDAGQAVGFDNGPANVAGEAVKGIALNAALTGEVVFLCRGGSCPATSGAAYAIGAQLETDNQGRLITLDTGRLAAVANEAATAADQTKSVFVK